MIEAIISALVGLITGAGGIILFFPQVRKSKILENEAKQSEEWKKLYDEERNLRESDRKRWEEERCQLDTKVDSLYDVISHHRDDKAALNKDNTKLEVENMRLCMLKCEVVNCPNRKPPTGY